MVIRNLRENDITEAMELKISCWTEELASKAENDLVLQDEVDFWIDWMNTPDEHNDIRIFIGAFESEELLGVAAASFIESKDTPENGVELNGLWVFPQYRGKGISLQMILHILDFFISLDVKKMEVYNRITL